MQIRYLKYMQIFLFCFRETICRANDSLWSLLSNLHVSELIQGQNPRLDRTVCSNCVRHPLILPSTGICGPCPYWVITRPYDEALQEGVHDAANYVWVWQAVALKQGQQSASLKHAGCWPNISDSHSFQGLLDESSFSFLKWSNLPLKSKPHFRKIWNRWRQIYF